MEFIRSPNNWSCLACCYAMVLSRSLSDIIMCTKHDGSKIIWPDLSEPRCRRGFGESELVYAALRYGYAPTVLSRDAALREGDRTWAMTHCETMFDSFMEWTTMDTFIAKLPGHAVVVTPKEVFDPANGVIKRSEFSLKDVYQLTLFTPRQRHEQQE